MRTTVRSLLGAAVIAVGVTSGGTVYAAQTMAAPAPSPVGAGPEAVRSAVLLSAPSVAVNAIDAARTAAEDAIAEATVAAARPR